ncbi:MAG: PAS domain S-box protein [Ignavibacteriaceae bacterium]|jgi:PAS domain S-box-containing protein|nr:PAS domain S-box protein [Ignavibacteriaceae bacterium]
MTTISNNLNRSLKLLLLEDSLSDKELMVEQLSEAGFKLDITHAENKISFIDSLKNSTYDIIVSDFKLPGFDAFGALEICNNICPDVPFICVSGSIGEETAIRLLKEGAFDYVLKDRPERLPHAIKRALDEVKENFALRKAERELLESENRFRQVAETAQEWIWEVDTNGLYTYSSPVINMLLGYTPEEVVGKRYFYDFFATDVKENLKKSAFEFFQKGKLFRNHETKNIHKNGHVVILSTSGSPIFNNQGNLIGYRGVDEDITDKKKSEDALKKSEEKFRNLFFNHAAVKLIIDPDTGKIIEANEAAASFYGWKIDILQNMNIIQLNALEPKETNNEMQNAIHQKKNYFEFKHRKADNTLVDVEIFSSMIKIGDKEYLHSIVHDISEKKTVEERLKLLNRAVESSSLAIQITDADGNVIYINPFFTTISGYSFEEIFGKNLRLLKSGNQSNSFYKELWDTILSGKDWNGEIQNKRKNGELYWVRSSISPIINKDGKITNFVAINEDITEKKKMIEDLMVAKDRAEEMNRVKSFFFANMSHELRTPFVGIMGYTEFLQSEIHNLEHQEMLKGIMVASKRMLGTLENILNLTKIEFDGLDLNRKPCKLKDIFDRLELEYQIQISNKKLNFIINNYDEKLVFFCDDSILTEVLSKLLSNAIKYTEKGTIEICSELEVKENEKILVIKVIDTGIGIPANKQSIIFDEFRQVSEGTARNFQGSGLGLSIVQKELKQLGGTISVESEENKGSTFIIRLPIEICEE